jgi:predicted nucleotidyltransferase
MPDEIAKSRLEQIVELLQAHRVEFIVIGGQAEILMGGARVTFDVDLCYRRTRRNLEALARALRTLGPTLRGAPPDLPFRIDAEAPALGCNFTFSTPLGNLDLLGHLDPLGGYDEPVERATTEHVGEVEVKVIGLDDLIHIRQYINRPRDRDSLMQLLAIKQLREQQAE